MKLSELEEKIIKKTMLKTAKVLLLAFRDKSDIFIGFYALLTAQTFINQFFDGCESETEFKEIKCCLLRNLSEFQKKIYAVEFKGGNNVRH